jgi:rRNA pseudouridine-1189 N-methylase Emg1 (Nep1/Mra1 family)
MELLHNEAIYTEQNELLKAEARGLDNFLKQNMCCCLWTMDQSGLSMAIITLPGFGSSLG